MDKISLYIIIMAMITFSVRYVFFSDTLKINLSETVKKLLTFTAPAILTSMWAPIVFGNINQVNEIPENPFLIAGVITILMSLVIKKTLVIVILSMSVFILLKNLI